MVLVSFDTSMPMLIILSLLKWIFVIVDPSALIAIQFGSLHESPQGVSTCLTECLQQEMVGSFMYGGYAPKKATPNQLLPHCKETSADVKLTD
jgi:hypothetical protein